MRIVALTFGTEGDWRPMTALCHGLAHAGQDVVLFAPAPAAPVARRLDVPFIALEGDMSAELEFAMPSVERGAGPVALGRIVTAFAQRHTAAWMRKVLEHSGDADVILPAGLAVYVGLSCAEHLHLPAIGVGLQPVMPTGDFPSVFLPAWRLPRWANRLSHRIILAAMWRAFRDATNLARLEVAGQAPRRVEWSGYPILFGISPTLLPRPRDWPDRYAVTGHWTTPIDPHWQPDTALVEFLAAGEPPVYVGFGSMLGFDRARAQRAVREALAGRRALIADGAVGLGDRAWPDDVLRIGPTPHQWLFPRVSVVVHHGGAGTTHAAAQAGVPSVVIPFGGDQAFWAARAHALGIAAEPLAHRALTGAALKARVDRASESDLRQRASLVGESIRHEDGIRTAVGALESLAAASHRSTAISASRRGG